MKSRFAFFVLFLTAVSFALLTIQPLTTVSFAAIDPTDKAALVALYTSTNGAGWTNNTGWADYATTNPCDDSWFGVMCSGDRVTLIVLDGNSLSGSIPPEIGDLTGLQTLSLSDNALTGSIPPSLGNLSSQLFNLWLNQNSLTGTIPPELGKLSSLQTLALYQNSLTGTIPPELGKLSSLQILALYQNSLTGEIPAELGNLGNLQNLWLDHNNLCGTVPLTLPNLDALQANTGLDLNNNYLDVNVSSSLGTFIAGKSAGYTDWTTTQQGVCPLDKAALIDLYNSTNGAGWSNSTGWTTGDPCATGWFGITCNPSNTYVISIELQENLLTGAIPASIGNLSQLTYLQMYGNSLTGSIPPEISNLINLQGIYLMNNQLTGSIPPQLGSLSQLTLLELGTNSLTGSIPPQLGNLTNLVQFYLNNNSLTGFIPEELGNLTNLLNLDVSSNSLSGTIPSELGNLGQNLSSLRLNNNELCGTIPPTLINLVNLTDGGGLDLSNNYLITAVEQTLDDFLLLKSSNDWKTTQGILPHCPYPFSWPMFMPAIIGAVR